MTVDELVRRVFQTEQRLMAANGCDIGRAEVMLSPEDYLDVVTEERKTPDQGPLAFDFETGQHTVTGHRLRMSRHLGVGEVRFRTEVAA